MDIYYKQNGDWNMYPLWYKSNGHWNLVGKSEDMIPLFGRLDVNEYTSLFEFPQSLGDFNSTGEQEHDYFASEEDGDPVVLTYNNFTINEGHIVTPTNRCKGMYLNILGDLVVNGTLSMTARGAKCEGQYIGIDKKNRIIYFNNNETSPFIKYRGMTTIDKVGGIGISGVVKGPYSNQISVTTIDDWRTNAASGINGACGAGGGTCGIYTYSPAKGGNGTSFSGGAGAGGGAGYWSRPNSYSQKGGDAEENGGAGGNGTIGLSASTQGQYGGGGAGNPGGICPNPNTWNGQNGTGGLMILFVSGNIIISDTGSIQSNGSNGGDGRPYSSSYYGTCGGGGSGGGAIHIFHQKSIINKNNIIANGGISGISGNTPFSNGIGDNGGNGTINIVKI